ncbi:hypothetical protein D8B26_006245 [Coccidioides posadasii str. Silveira]|uniref:uncharacterized protein n=1 Tax=Coccidioides posadasii (strain RMSCC 757 / Silveira) TaxID=443226 RepID=UPI001BEEE4D4|nr:hypothetical protein D8B26_006245 [Coccidioides posadasii str. Silveira]
MAPKKQRKKTIPKTYKFNSRAPSSSIDQGNQNQTSSRKTLFNPYRERAIQDEQSVLLNRPFLDQQLPPGTSRAKEMEKRGTIHTERQKDNAHTSKFPGLFEEEDVNTEHGDWQMLDANSESTSIAARRHASGLPLGIQTQAHCLPVIRPGLQLPEPPLTAVLPKQRAVSMPSVNKQELSSMLATTEQYLSGLRLNQNKHAGGLGQVPLPRASRIAIEGQISQRVHPADSIVTLPSIGNPGYGFQGDSTKLPPVIKQLLADADARRAYHRRKVQVAQGRHDQYLAGTGPRTTASVMNSRAPPRNGPERENTMSVTPEMYNPYSRVRKTTPRTLRSSRLLFRGPSNGYLSFGDLAQTDMPSPSLEHFSVTKLSRTAVRYDHARAYEQREPKFSVFQELLKRPELIITLACHLRVQELLILYRISKSFHNIINQRYTTVILSQALRHAPESAKIFPYRCYSRLCIDDPAERPHPVAQRAAAGQHRKVPSFRWLLMICFREMICHEIRMIMDEDGTPLPEQCETVMKKIWFVMDIPDTIRRIGTIQNREVFTDADIFFATMLFVKIDMRFTDPITGSGRDGMRRMLLSQPSLSILWKALSRTALVSKMDAVKMFVRWKWQPPARLLGQPVFGIPANEIGIMQFEGWGRTGSRVRLQRPDEIILKESVHRRLNLHLHYTDMFLWGYVNPNSLQDMPPIPERRNLERLEGMEELLIPKDDGRDRSIGKLVSGRVVFD